MNLLIRSKLAWHEFIGTGWLIFDFFSIMDLLSFLLCVLVQANSPKNIHLDVEFKASEAAKERVHADFCTKCDSWKPPRTHHCRYCRRCVLMYDHHCSWVGNCIGHGNLHFFTQYLLYTSVGAFYSLALFSYHWAAVVSYYSDETSKIARLRLLCFIWLIYTAFLFVLSGLVTSFRLFKIFSHLSRGITAYEALLLAAVRPFHQPAFRPSPKHIFWIFGSSPRGLGEHAKEKEDITVERREEVDKLQSILDAERRERRCMKLFFGRFWPFALLLPVPGDPARELSQHINLWEAMVGSHSSCCA